MKLNKQVTCSKVIDDKEFCHLTELSEKISEMIQKIILEDDLDKNLKNQIEDLDKLSILKIAWKEKIIKQIIEDCINNDLAILTNSQWSLYQLEVFWSKYHIEVQNWLNTVNKNIYSIQNKTIDKPITDDLIMVLSCSEDTSKYFVLYKVTNFDLNKDI